MTRWHGLSAESRATFWRSLQTLNVTRVVIALVLLAYVSFNTRAVGVSSYFLDAEACIFYLLMSVGFALLTLYRRHRFLLQLSIQIAVDIGVISMLYLAGGGLRSGLVILYLFPLAGAAILAPLVLALFSASLVTLFLLADSTWQVFFEQGEPRLMQAGLYGASFFAIVLAVNSMAAKLIRQEELAVQRGIDLKTQQAINQIVTADVADGVLVVCRDGGVFASNPAARSMLGLPDGVADFALGDIPALAPVAFAFVHWLGQPDEHAAFVTLKPYSDAPNSPNTLGLGARREQSAHLKLRFARVATPEGAAGRCVIFMHDVTAIENQAQQLKLASMGRLTASIAHEVRNPLAAIGHATALLAEDLESPVHARLLKIVGDNVTRVNRMVEDILQLSRKVQPNGEPLHLDAFLSELKSEFTETHGLADDIVWIGSTGTAPVRFDALHLREVVVNLLNNAIRYASRLPGSMRLWVVQAAGQIELHVQDDGPGITPEVRAHLFEPFYTTSSKGTGLGLYLARELCLNNEAKLDYEYRFDAGPAATQHPSGRFVITFAPPAA